MDTSSGFFYDKRHDLTLKSARIVLNHVFNFVDKGNSVIDVGCGVGTWLHAAQEFGVEHISGIEGPWLENVNNLVVPKRLIKLVDLEKDWMIEGSYDLSICLEVAEHLSEVAGSRLVNNLCKHSHSVLFSAGVPRQVGQGHINLQWPSYWQQLFQKHGFYAVDCIRPVIWDLEEIPWWYRQNIVLVIKESSLDLLIEKSPALVKKLFKQPLIGAIHPEAPQLGKKSNTGILTKSFRALRHILTLNRSNA